LVNSIKRKEKYDVAHCAFKNRNSSTFVLMQSAKKGGRGTAVQWEKKKKVRNRFTK